MNWQALDASILLPALAAGLLVLSTHVPLGQMVLKRGIIFIDLAVAQVAGLGVIAADTLGLEVGGWGIQLTAAGAAIMAALLLNWLENHWPDVQEALIGIMFVLAATGGVLILSGNPHGGEHLKDLLVGQILWVTYEQLWPIALIYAGIVSIWYGYARNRSPLWFYTLFALAVTASVQLVGVYLVFASLIVPALATRSRTGGQRLMLGYIIGALSFGLGLILSTLWDLPPGAVIVWALAGVATIAGFMIARLSGKSSLPIID